MLLRRSNSLRQGLGGGSRRRKSSLEEIGINHFNSLLQHQQQQQRQNADAYNFTLNGSIGLEVTPPDEGPSDRFGGPFQFQDQAAALPSTSSGSAPSPDPMQLQGTIV